MERQRLEELKISLERERDKNAALTQRIRAQNRTVTNMQVEQDIIRRKNTIYEEKLEKIM